MLDDLLKKIKAALPEPLKSKLLKKSHDEDEDEDEDDDEEEGEFDEDTEVGAKKTKKSKKAKDDDDSEDDDEDDEESDDEDDEDDEDEDEATDTDEEAKKKKKQLLIRGLIAVVLIYVVVDELFLKNDDDLVQRQLDAAPAPRPVGQRPVVAPVQDQASADDVSSAEAPPLREERISESATPQAPAAPDPVMAENKENEIDWGAPNVEDEFRWEEPAEVVQEQPIIEEPYVPEPVQPTPSPPSSRVGEAPAPKPIQQVQTQPKPDKPQDIAGQIAGIVADKVEYTAPPDYSILGRGLVYNCSGKHWACIDRKEYFECRDNMVWSEQNKKAPECVIRNVYASYEDCKTIQIHYINMAESTDFCGQ